MNYIYSIISLKEVILKVNRDLIKVGKNALTNLKKIPELQSAIHIEMKRDDAYNEENYNWYLSSKLTGVPRIIPYKIFQDYNRTNIVFVSDL